MTKMPFCGNINTAARNIREMALNDDESTYDSYEEKVKELLFTRKH